jgi:hypothetical protein
MFDYQLPAVNLDGEGSGEQYQTSDTLTLASTNLVHSQAFS